MSLAHRHNVFTARSRLRRPALAGLATAAALVAIPSVAQADPDVRRHGGQWEVLIGGAACMPGRVDCNRSSADIIVGDTRPSFGTGATLGWRATRWLMIGGAYRFGMFDPDYKVVSGPSYGVAYQHSAFFVFKPIIPIWRIDLGLDLAPGFSRQVFRRTNGDKDYSQGFAFMIGPSIDFWVAPRVFLGAKVDFILNAHRQVCEENGGSTSCSRTETRNLAPVHQALFGFHLGGTFGG